MLQSNRYARGKFHRLNDQFNYLLFFAVAESKMSVCLKKRRLLTLAFEYNVRQCNGAKFHVNNFSTKSSRHSSVRRAPVQWMKCPKFSNVFRLRFRMNSKRRCEILPPNGQGTLFGIKYDAESFHLSFYCFSFELHQYLKFIAFYWHAFAVYTQVERAHFPSNGHKHYLKF